MECREVREMLAAYLEGALSDEEGRTIRNHLSSCEECSAAVEDMKKTGALVKSLEEVEPPPWLAEKVMAHVREEAQKRKGLLEWLFYPLRVKVPIEALATLLVVAMATYLYETNVPQYEAARMARGTMQAPRQDGLSTAPHKETDSTAAKKEKIEGALPRQKQETPPPSGIEAQAEQERQARLEGAARTESSKAPSVGQGSLRKEAPSPPPGEDGAAEKRAFSAAPGEQGRLQANAPEVFGPEPMAARSPSRTGAAPAPAAAPKSALKKSDERLDFTLRVTDVGAAAQEVERMLNEAGAHRLNKEPGTGSATIAGVIDGDKVDGLVRKLRSMGARGDFDPGVDRGDTVAVRVGISGRMKADKKGMK